MHEISIVKKAVPNISPDVICKVTVLQNSAEIAILKYQPYDFKCLKLSGNTYLNQRTGEILNYELTDNNKKSIGSLRKSFKKLYYLILNNFEGGQSEIFMTLGYEYIMSDIKQLSKDFNLFRRKLKRRNKDFEYISVAEYKGNESLHLHILIKSNSNKRLFFDRNLIIKLWGQRDVYIERIHNSMDIERIAKYLNPFTNPKKFKRLNYYKRNFRIYNCSNGIIQPKITQLSFREAMTYMNQNGYIKNNSKSYNIVANIDNYNDIILNSVTKIYLQKRKGEISQ